ncbi:SDR family oxidoreductase [Novosphingobium sp. PC22D]|uniref:SDR family NAD(P)-dependent oxidoreductase n=1 Tax=Novosphingobium sp. PC22D TaxID=1962403 RepID=UPI000BF12FFC|nr:SDR family oxidoreductase [Novosphingobium sp. PC22D]
MANSLAGRVAIVTGAAGGIGRAIVTRLRAAGAAVLATDIKELGDDAPGVFRHDIASEDSWAALRAHVDQRHGGCDLLVNNAAHFDPQPLERTSLASFERHFAVNQKGLFLALKAAPALFAGRQGGAIVNIGSVAGLSGGEGAFAYTASKWAMRGMSRSAARELSPLGIRVNTILPGLIDTPMAAVNPPERTEAIRGMIPQRRIGAPQDVAEAVCWLAGDAAAYVTGAELTVDGGIAA